MNDTQIPPPPEGFRLFGKGPLPIAASGRVTENIWFFSEDLQEWIHGGPGASLRDLFAGMALQGMLAQPLGHGENWHHVMCAETAYKFADAMLAERSKR